VFTGRIEAQIKKRVLEVIAPSDPPQPVAIFHVAGTKRVAVS
jgi:hypothetical protein